jgi:hypothetical protein
LNKVSSEDHSVFNPWLAFSLKAMELGMEAQTVIALRMMRLAAGGARAEAEAQRMVTEKLSAATEAQVAAATALMTGRKSHVAAGNALRVVRKRVRANKRRLSRRK